MSFKKYLFSSIKYLISLFFENNFRRNSKSMNIISKLLLARSTKKYIEDTDNVRLEYVWFNSLAQIKKVEYLRDKMVIF